MNKYVLFPALDKVLVSEDGSEVDDRLLKLLKSIKGVEVTDLTPYYCELELPEGEYKALKAKVEKLSGELHAAEKPALIDPITPPISIFKEMLYGNEED